MHIATGLEGQRDRTGRAISEKRKLLRYASRTSNHSHSVNQKFLVTVFYATLELLQPVTILGQRVVTCVCTCGRDIRNVLASWAYMHLSYG